MTFIDHLSTAIFWIALGKIIWIDLLLSGDNAVVIALASRKLPTSQQRSAVLWGSFAAIALRVVMTFFAVRLLEYPYLKLVGSALLFWIGIKLLTGEKDEPEIESADSLWMAIRTIIIADLVMSLDNVIAVAGAAETGPEPTRFALLLFGLGLSIPLIMLGSTLILKIMGRYPFVVTLGAALLGFIAGEIAMSDPALERLFPDLFAGAGYVVGVVLAVLVVVIGKWRAAQVAKVG